MTARRSKNYTTYPIITEHRRKRGNKVSPGSDRGDEGADKGALRETGRIRGWRAGEEEADLPLKQARALFGIKDT